MTRNPDLSHAVLAHFYRAVVMHMDVWRQRMDATTNWAAATTAAMVTFSFSASESPHFVLLLAIGFNCTFLVMESRRYQIFDLWRKRFRILNRNLIAPVLTGDEREISEERTAALTELARDLGSLVPRIRLTQAAGYRIRRNYGYLFAVSLVSWILKLEVHPTPTGQIGELVQRAAIGVLPGFLVVAMVVAMVMVLTLMALLAPSEQMQDWNDVPSPFFRYARAPWRGHRRPPAPGDPR